LKKLSATGSKKEIITIENKKMMKNEIPPRAGFDVELHLIMVSLVFLIPRFLENFNKNRLIISENNSDAMKNKI
jgi:hypothetical protein